jgi:hypothetical protein
MHCTARRAKSIRSFADDLPGAWNEWPVRRRVAPVPVSRQ